MASSRSTAHLKERKVLSSGTTSSAHSIDGLHGRPSPKSSVPSSPEGETTRSTTQRRPLISPSSSSISRTAKNQQPSSATTAPNRRLPATKKPSDNQKPVSSSLQPKPSSTSHTPRQPASSTTAKERTTPRTSSSSLLRTGISSGSKSTTGVKAANPTGSGTSQRPSARAKSTGSIITKVKEIDASPPYRSTSEELNVVPESEELEEESATPVEENDSISISSPKDYESDDPKETPDKGVSEPVDADFLPEQSDHHEAEPSEQEPEPALNDDGSKEHGGSEDTDEDPEEWSDEKQGTGTLVQSTEESHETDQQKHVADAEESKEPLAQAVDVAELPVASAEPEKEMVEREKTAMRVMIYKKPEVVQGWKNDAATNNEVLEEARSKLLEKRKNKVLALVGAFETVMSLQEPDGQTGQTQEGSAAKGVKEDASSNA